MIIEKCEACNGRGRRGDRLEPKKCVVCGGTGQIKRMPNDLDSERVGREVLIDMINSGGAPAFILGGAIAFAENQGTPAEREMARVLDAALKQWLLDNPRKDLH